MYWDLIGYLGLQKLDKMQTMTDNYHKLNWLWHPAAISCIVSGVFLVFAPFQLYSLQNEKAKVKPGARAHFKLVSITRFCPLTAATNDA